MLRAYDHQVGGHSLSKGGGQPSSLLDEEGRFLKRLQEGERGEREERFYARVEAVRSPEDVKEPGASGRGGSSCRARDGRDGRHVCGGSHCKAGTCRLQPAPAPAAGSQLTAAAGPSGRPGPLQEEQAQLRALARWIPSCFGVRAVGAARYLVLADAAAGYAAPCVLDAKLGRRTWYPWAGEAAAARYRVKDEATTQAALGFRLCGVVVRRLDGGEWREDRHWGKALDAAGTVAALRRFADNGALQPLDVFGPAADELHEAAAVACLPAAHHVFSASALLLYEGAARRAADAHVQLRLIDFAHAFPAGSHPGCAGPDDNLRAGLEGLAAALEEAAAGEGPSRDLHGP